MPEDCLAILDIAPIGPNYLPGHGHADTLSFELSLFGQRVLVNSGTSLYEDGEERLRQRSTAAHNTVMINDENSSEVWGSFRVARRARPSEPIITKNDEFISITASHDGYKRLSGKPIHQRNWSFTEKTLMICDTIQGYFKKAEARFHVHPDVSIETVDAAHRNFVLFLKNGKKIYISVVGASPVLLEQSTWHPKFGASIPNICLVVPFKQNELTTHIKW